MAAPALTNVTVTNSATSLLAVDTTRQRVTIYNNGSGTIFLGLNSSVTTAAGSNNGGVPIPAGAVVEITTGAKDAWFAIGSAASNDVRIVTE